MNGLLLLPASRTVHKAQECLGLSAEKLCRRAYPVNCSAGVSSLALPAAATQSSLCATLLLQQDQRSSTKRAMAAWPQQIDDKTLETIEGMLGQAWDLAYSAFNCVLHCALIRAAPRYHPTMQPCCAVYVVCVVAGKVLYGLGSNKRNRAFVEDELVPEIKAKYPGSVSCLPAPKGKPRGAYLFALPDAQGRERKELGLSKVVRHIHDNRLPITAVRRGGGGVQGWPPRAPLLLTLHLV